MNGKLCSSDIFYPPGGPPGHLPSSPLLEETLPVYSEDESEAEEELEEVYTQSVYVYNYSTYQCIEHYNYNYIYSSAGLYNYRIFFASGCGFR